MLTLKLTPLPEYARRGIYPVPGGDHLPDRFRFLHPDATASLRAFEAEHRGVLYFSDMFRTAAGSRDARRRRGKHAGGTQPPGYSHHSFGGAFDCDIRGTLQRSGWSYDKLLTELSKHDWYCHRRDGGRGKEEWHFNFLPRGNDQIPHHFAHVEVARPVTWARAAEVRIQELYGPQLRLDDRDVQLALKETGFYGGEIDGVLGKMSRAATEAFQRAWDLAATGKADPRTRRVLAVVTARREVS